MFGCVKIVAQNEGDIQEHDGQIFPAVAPDMWGAEDAPSAGIDQDGEDQPWMIGILVFDYEGFSDRAVACCSKSLSF